MKNTKVTVNVAEQRQQLQNDFEQFHRDITKNNEELLKVHKVVSSKRLLYLIILNIFLLFITGFSMYVAVKNTINKSQYRCLANKKRQLRNQLENVNQFLNENPKTSRFFRESSQKR